MFVEDFSFLSDQTPLDGYFRFRNSGISGLNIFKVIVDIFFNSFSYYRNQSGFKHLRSLSHEICVFGKQAFSQEVRSRPFHLKYFRPIFIGLQ